MGLFPDSRLSRHGPALALRALSRLHQPLPVVQAGMPFAGATRNLLRPQESHLNDQAGAIAKFYIYTSTHKASKFTGIITDDFTSEFDPFSPQLRKVLLPRPARPIRDWTGAETNRVYATMGAYNGMSYSTWEVNPPNPTGYSPTMMVPA